LSATIGALRESIDALALEVTLRDLNAPEQCVSLLSALSRIRDQAACSDLPALASAASALPASDAAWLDLASRLQQMIGPEAPVAPAPAPLNQDPELVGDFILESREHLAAIEAQLLALEQNPHHSEAVNTIFRGFHTMKGLAGFLEFADIQSFAHEVETLLDLARNSKIAVDSTLIDIIL